MAFERVVFDIEANGLFHSCTKFHTMTLHCLDTGAYKRFDRDHEPIFRGVDILNGAKEIIGHNIISFDVPSLRKLYKNFNPTGKIIDTLLLSELIFTATLVKTDTIRANRGLLPKSLIGSHSLKAWGYRLGELKGEFSEQEGEWWLEYSKDMSDYCEQDVRVTVKLYETCLEYIKKRQVPQKAIDLEHAFATIISRQERYGIHIDLNKAHALEVELRAELAIASEELQKTFTPKFLPSGKPKRINKGMRKKIMVPVNLSLYSTEGEEKEIVSDNTRYSEGSYHQAIEYTQFNPGSSAHIIKWLTDMFGWEPTEFTDKGSPKTDADTLETLDYPGMEPLQRYVMLQKRLSQLTDGKGSILNKVIGTRLHGRVDTLGAITRRCTHSNPNMAQVPAVTAEFGEPFRAMLGVLPGRKLIGADASGLELRTLAHYLARFDGGEYAEDVVNGDIHWRNAQALELVGANEVRDKENEDHKWARDKVAKTFIYAFLYGAGDVKLGSIIYPTGSLALKKKTGKSLKKKFMANNPAIAKLITGIKEASSTKKYIRDIDGNRIYVRSDHSAPNVVLQSCGAIIMKYWLVTVDSHFKEMEWLNYDDCMHLNRLPDAEFVLNVHDEAQVDGREDIAKDIAKIMEDSFHETGIKMGLRVSISGEAKIGNNWADTH